MKTWLPGLGLLLIACMIAVPGASADTNTTDPAHYLTHAEHLAGPRDMSAYNPPVKPVPILTMDEATARRYPDVTACGKDGCMRSNPCLSPFTRCESPLTHQIVYNVNASHPDKPGPVVAYGLSGWPLQDPANDIPFGKPGILPACRSFFWRI